MTTVSPTPQAAPSEAMKPSPSPAPTREDILADWLEKEHGWTPEECAITAAAMLEPGSIIEQLALTPSQSDVEAAREFCSKHLMSDGTPSIGFRDHLASLLASRGTRALTEAASDVVAERHRQVSQEGWSPDHDDEHNTGELARAAACYAIGELLFRPMNHHNGFPDLQAIWPWDPQWWKPGDARRNLVKAGALIIAEIERLDRLTGEPST